MAPAGVPIFAPSPAGRGAGGEGIKLADLEEIAIPSEKARSWTVEADFIAAIRDGKPIELTTFEAGVAYMEFTEAVARSADGGKRGLPLPAK